MAGNARKILIEFIGKDSGSGKVASDLEKKFGKLGARMDQVGRVSGRILAGGLLLAGAAAVKAGQAAADDEAAQAQLAQQLRNATGATQEQIAATEEWIAAQGVALGVADDELRPALAKLATATGDVGKAQRLASLAMDVAAGTGKDLNQVTEALVRAQNGSIGGLSRLGIATKDAAGKTMTLTAVTDAMAKKYKGAAANAADTTAGKQRKLQVAFGELQEEIGTRLIPVLTQLATAGLVVVDWIGNNQTTVAVLIGTLGGLLAVTWAVTKAIAVWTAITKIAAAAQIVFTNVQWALNVAMAANPIGLVIVALVALAAGLVVAYKKSETFRKIVDASFSAIAKVVGVVVEFIKRNWKLMLVAITGPFGIAVALIVKNWDTIKAAGIKVADWLRSKWSAVQTLITAPFTAAKAVVSRAWDAIQNGAKAAKEAIVKWIGLALVPIRNLINALQTAINKFNELRGKRTGGVKGTPVTGREGEQVGRTFGDDLSRGIAAADKKVSEATQKLLDRLKSKLSSVKDLFSGLKESVAGTFTSGLFDAESASGLVANLQSTSGTLAALKTAFKTLVDWGLKPAFLSRLFQEGGAGLILDMAKNKAAAQEAGSLFGSVMTQSNQLGGLVAGEQYGDQIKNLQGQIKDAQGKPDKGRINNQYNLTVNMGTVTDPVAAAREIEKLFRRLERETGRQLLLAGR